ncbi:hypothetical protein JCM8547_002565 [Rhodosporidiobolus lusitaniae]
MPSLSTVFPSDRFGDSPVVVLDGGMGTTLQAPPFELALDSALWSSELLANEEGRKTLTKLHETWVDAGADVIETCTYQSSLPLFLPASSSSYDSSTISAALLTMVSAIPLTSSCCSSPPSTPSQPSPIAALSLGPYGSSLQPGQEYGGLYPAPFATADATYTSPSSAACSSAALAASPLPLDEIRSSSSVSSGGSSSIPEHEVHLAAWHLQRLQHFSTSPAFDSGISLLAFETVPVLAEARAIRRAVGVFNASRCAEGKNEKPFYVSFVFPRVNEGEENESVRFPDPSEEVSKLETLEEQAVKVVKAAFGGDEVALARPGGIGLNCTSPLHAHTVVSALSSALSSFTSSSSAGGQEKPFLLLYPDGGAIYDVHTRSWHHPAGLTNSKWAGLVAGAVQVGRESGAWEGVVVGGCCKAGPGAIRALRDEVGRRGWRKA